MLGMPPLYKRGTDSMYFGFDNDQPKGKVVRGAGCELRGVSISITKFTELWWNDGVFEGTEEHLRVFWKLSIIWDFYGMTKWLRQAQPPEFDRLSHRNSTGSATGIRQAQPPEFDRLSHRASWTSFVDLQHVLNHQLKLWGYKVMRWLKAIKKMASTGSATGIRQAQPPGFVNFVRRPSVCAQSPIKVMRW